MQYWLVKSEPFVFSWEQFVKEGKCMWDGVRNYQARNNLMEMNVGDLVLFYHSNQGLEVVGVAKVIRSAYPDPTADNPRWVAVDLAPVESLPRSVSLEAIRKEPRLEKIALVRQSRLSVMPLLPEEFDAILEMGYREVEG